MNNGIFKYIKKKKIKESNSSQEVLVTNKIDFFEIQNDNNIKILTDKNNGISDNVKINHLECEKNQIDKYVDNIKNCNSIIRLKKCYSDINTDKKFKKLDKLSKNYDINNKKLQKSSLIISLKTDNQIKSIKKTEKSTDSNKEKYKSIPHTAMKLKCSDYNTINKHVLLPKKYLNLSRIYRVMNTIQKYNMNRNLSNIFSVLVNSMEQILKNKIYLKDIEQIKYLIKEKIIIKLIKYNDENTFTFKLLIDNDEFDRILWEYYQENKDKTKRVDEDVCDIPRSIIFTENKDDLKENEVIDNICDKKIITEKICVLDKNVDKECKYTNNKKLSILERIKEREKQRKEKFIIESQKTDNSLFLKKLNKYYKKEKKQCIKVSEIIKVFDLYDGYNYLKKLIVEEDSYQFKNIFGHEYLKRKSMNV